MASPSQSRGFNSQNQSSTGSAASGSNNNFASGLSIVSAAFKNGSLKSPRSHTRLADAKQQQQQQQASSTSSTSQHQQLQQHQQQSTSLQPIQTSHPPSLSRRQSLVDPSAIIAPNKLIDFLLKAKSNLASVANAVEASSGASDGASLLEAGVAMHAYSQHMATNIFHQLVILRAFRDSQVKTLETADAQFLVTGKEMDKADGELKMKLAAMGKVTVEKELRPAGEGAKTLLDFIEHSNIENLEREMKISLDELRKFRKEYLHEIESFTRDVAYIPDLLIDLDLPTSLDRSGKLKSKNPASVHQRPIMELTHLYRLVEESVEEIAHVLTSLSDHYDHCFAAVRYTPEAFALATTHANDVFASEQDPESLERLRPGNFGELLQLYQVIQSDSIQAMESVDTIHELTRKISGFINSMRTVLKAINACHQNVRQALLSVSDIGSRLPELEETENVFIEMWSSERRKVHEGISQMDSLTHTYDGCRRSYSALLVEADRRRTVEERIFLIYEKARKEAKRLVDYDRGEVDKFRGTWGEMMPKDLWPLLETNMTDFEVVAKKTEGKTEEEEEMLRAREGADGGYRMPRLKRELVEGAARSVGLVIREKEKEGKERDGKHGHGHHGHRDHREHRDRHADRHR